MFLSLEYIIIITYICWLNLQRALHSYPSVRIYDNFEYDGGENFFRKNLMMYSGKHETSVMADTFHRNSSDEMNSRSVADRNDGDSISMFI